MRLCKRGIYLDHNAWSERRARQGRDCGSISSAPGLDLEYSQGFPCGGGIYRVAGVRVPLTRKNTDCQDLYSGSGRDTLKVKRTSEAAAGETSWSTGLTVRAEGSGTVAHAGVVLPRLLADQVGLTTALGTCWLGRGSCRTGAGR